MGQQQLLLTAIDVRLTVFTDSTYVIRIDANCAGFLWKPVA
jgi:hypothetical protein